MLLTSGIICINEFIASKQNNYNDHILYQVRQVDSETRQIALGDPRIIDAKLSADTEECISNRISEYITAKKCKNSQHESEE